MIAAGGGRRDTGNSLHTHHTVRCQISPTAMRVEIEMTPKVQKAVAAGTGAIGVGLVAMMIVVEGELGALPLALVLIGAVCYATAKIRERSAARL